MTLWLTFIRTVQIQSFPMDGAQFCVLINYYFMKRESPQDIVQTNLKKIMRYFSQLIKKEIVWFQGKFEGVSDEVMGLFWLFCHCKRTTDKLIQPGDQTTFKQWNSSWESAQEIWRPFLRRENLCRMFFEILKDMSSLITFRKVNLLRLYCMFRNWTIWKPNCDNLPAYS